MTVPVVSLRADPKWLHDAEKEEILITRHGEPAGVLIGFESDDAWFDYRLENDPRFFSRVEAARRSSLRERRGVRLEKMVGSTTPKPDGRKQRLRKKSNHPRRSIKDQVIQAVATHRAWSRGRNVLLHLAF